ncbi:MAG: putative MPP superfamily phosphohydrolase [Crocinitomix sp.]
MFLDVISTKNEGLKLIMRTLIFASILIGFVALLEWYTYRALKSRWNTYKLWFKKTLKVAHLTLMSLSIISFFTLLLASGNLPFWIFNFFFAFIVINLIAKVVFAVFLLLDDVIRAGRWTYKKVRPAESSQSNLDEGITRSDFILKSGILAAAVPVISLSSGMVIGPYKYTLHQPTVNLPNLPASFNGLKIVQISDIHSGSFYNKVAVNKGIDLLLAQKPDIIFFTGDLVNDSAEEMTNYMDVFSRVSAPLGVFSILGNHDYGDYGSWENDEAKLANFNRIKAIHAELGWRLLLDEHVYIERGADKIALIGVENWGAGFHQIGDLATAYNGCEAPVKLLLSHDPTHWDEEVRKSFKDIDITFSGHTHGAQMGIETGGFKWSPISLRYEKWAGLYQEEHQYLYINRGYGFLGYPGRIGIWPEITVMTLTTSNT